MHVCEGAMKKRESESTTTSIMIILYSHQIHSICMVRNVCVCVRTCASVCVCVTHWNKTRKSKMTFLHLLLLPLFFCFWYTFFQEFFLFVVSAFFECNLVTHKMDIHYEFLLHSSQRWFMYAERQKIYFIKTFWNTKNWFFSYSLRFGFLLHRVFLLNSKKIFFQSKLVRRTRVKLASYVSRVHRFSIRFINRRNEMAICSVKRHTQSGTMNKPFINFGWENIELSAHKNQSFLTIWCITKNTANFDLWDAVLRDDSILNISHEHSRLNVSMKWNTERYYIRCRRKTFKNEHLWICSAVMNLSKSPSPTCIRPLLNKCTASVQHIKTC